MNEILNRLSALRKEMKKYNVDMLYVPTNDYHLSEYVGEYFKARQYITGFTGSAGVCIVTQEQAILWTDGRYFLQAENQLKDTTVELYKMGEEGVPTTLEFIQKNLKENQTFAFDARVIETSFGKKVATICQEKHAKLLNIDLISLIWNDRPSISKEKAFLVDKKMTGETRVERINFVQSTLCDKNYDCTVIGSLDDLMWLFNIRGADVKYSPVLLSYAIVFQEKVFFYCFRETLSDEIYAELVNDGVEIKDYYQVYDDLKEIKNLKISIDEARVNYAIYEELNNNNQVFINQNFTQLPKATKNRVEIKNIKAAHIKDGVAMCKFIYWLKHSPEEKTEVSVADKLLSFREEQEGFIEPSFNTICGWGPHGAIVHYSANAETDAKITNNNFLLVDSGGQYLDGTTDITRTIVIGKVPHQMKRDFTLVLKSHLNMMNAKFIHGTKGASLDVIAREPLWKYGLNYNHGTGHGVGFLLNVHEGPNGLGYNRFQYCTFEEGMVTSNEPGLYITNKYGIRHENLVVCKKGIKNEFGQFMSFENLTYVPFDLSGIDKKLLTKEEIKILNNYHTQVYKKISPYLSFKERRWLKTATRSI